MAARRGKTSFTGKPGQYPSADSSAPDEASMDEVQKALEYWMSSSTAPKRVRPSLTAPKDLDAAIARTVEKRAKRASETSTPENPDLEANLKQASQMGLKLLQRNETLARECEGLREELATRDAKIATFEDGSAMDSLLEQQESQLASVQDRSTSLAHEITELRRQQSSSEEHSQKATGLARAVQKQASSQLADARSQVTDLTQRLRVQSKELGLVNAERSMLSERMDMVQSWFKRISTLKGRVRSILEEFQEEDRKGGIIRADERLKKALSMLDQMGLVDQTMSPKTSPRSPAEPNSPTRSRRNSNASQFLESMLKAGKIVEPEAEDQGSAEAEARYSELLASEQSLMDELKKSEQSLMDELQSEKNAAAALHKSAQQVLGSRCPKLVEASGPGEAALVLAAFRLEEKLLVPPAPAPRLSDAQAEALEKECREVRVEASRLRAESVRLRAELDEADAGNQMASMGDKTLQRTLLRLDEELKIEKSLRSDSERRLRRAIENADALALVAEELAVKQEGVVLSLEGGDPKEVTGSSPVNILTGTQSSTWSQITLRGSGEGTAAVMGEIPAAALAERECLRRLDKSFQELRGQLEGVVEGARDGVLDPTVVAKTKEALAQITADSKLLNKELLSSEAKCQQLDAFLNRAALSLEDSLQDLYEKTTDAMTYHSSELQRLEHSVTGLTHHVNAHLSRVPGSFMPPPPPMQSSTVKPPVGYIDGQDSGTNVTLRGSPAESASFAPPVANPGVASPMMPGPNAPLVQVAPMVPGAQARHQSPMVVRRAQSPLPAAPADVVRRAQSPLPAAAAPPSAGLQVPGCILPVPKPFKPPELRRPEMVPKVIGFQGPQVAPSRGSMGISGSIPDFRQPYRPQPNFQ